MIGNFFKKIRYTLLILVMPCAFIHAADVSYKSGADTTQVIDAVWQEQSGRFLFTSFSTYYSCHGLEASLESLLEELGAKDVKARALGCSSSRVERVIPIRVTFKSLTTDASANGDSVSASYHDLDFNKSKRQRSFRYAGSRCDLIREVEKSLIDKFEHEIIKKQGICDSSHSSISNDEKWKLKILKPIS